MTHPDLLIERITEAVDGKLSDAELHELTRNLEHHPDLAAELRMQMRGSNVRTAYSEVYPGPFAVSSLRTRLKNVHNEVWQYDIWNIFKRYVLVSGVAAILLVASMHLLTEKGNTNSTANNIADEMDLLFETLEQEALSWSLPDSE